MAKKDQTSNGDQSSEGSTSDSVQSKKGSVSFLPPFAAKLERFKRDQAKHSKSKRGQPTDDQE